MDAFTLPELHRILRCFTKLNYPEQYLFAKNAILKAKYYIIYKILRILIQLITIHVTTSAYWHFRLSPPNIHILFYQTVNILIDTKEFIKYK